MDQHAFHAAVTEAAAPPDYEGYIDQRSTRHIAGWARDLANPALRLDLEIILAAPAGARILARTTANLFDDQTIAALGSRDANYAFYLMFDPPVSDAALDQIRVRVAGTDHYLRMAFEPVSVFEPINHIAMDIVNNCNLRCPFCMFDYAATQKTEFMTAATFAKFLPLLPYVRDGNFWLSCLHEATLHPQFLDFIGQVPREYRKKIMFTTNLAKRMPDDYFTCLADSGIHHINISVESLKPQTYETLRAGARHHIFAENLEKLWRAFAATPRPPALRYIILAYRSNLAEIPDIVRYFLDKPATSEIEVRTTINRPHIPQDFRDSEYLHSADWRWLDAELQIFSSNPVIKIFPAGLKGYDEHRPVRRPGQPVGRPFTPDLKPTPRPLNLSVSWDGAISVYSNGLGVDFFKTNVNELADPLATLLAL